MTTGMSKTENLATVAIFYKSEKVIPKQNRAAWLEKWGIPPRIIEFEANASLTSWEAAGCNINAKGEVTISDAAKKALCVEATALIEGVGHEQSLVIPNDRVDSALKKAEILVEAQSRIMDEIKRRTKRAEKQARNYAMTSGDPELEALAKEAYDVRTAVLRKFVAKFEELVGTDYTIKTTKSSDCEERNSPSITAIDARYSMIDLVEQFERPGFLNIEVKRVSRTKLANGKFQTVVPVMFEIDGIQPTFIAWNAER
jgi:hypothetical protein